MGFYVEGKFCFFRFGFLSNRGQNGKPSLAKSLKTRVTKMFSMSGLKSKVVGFFN